MQVKRLVVIGFMCFYLHIAPGKNSTLTVRVYIQSRKKIVPCMLSHSLREKKLSLLTWQNLVSAGRCAWVVLTSFSCYAS